MHDGNSSNLFTFAHDQTTTLLSAGDKISARINSSCLKVRIVVASSEIFVFEFRVRC